MKDGGSVVPHSMLEEVLAVWTMESPYASLWPKTEYPPLSRRQRLRAVIWDLRFRIAKVIYPPSYSDDS